jgi:hypothetical protein
MVRGWLTVALAVAWIVGAVVGLEMGLRADDGAWMVQEFTK